MSEFKRFGCCSVCDAEVFEVVQRWPRDHRYLPGEPRTLGRPLPGARRATLVLTWSGHICNMTLCGDCNLDEKNIPAIWQKTLRTMARERQDDYRVSINTKPLKPGREANTVWDVHRIMAADVPLGVLAIENWSEVNG